MDTTTLLANIELHVRTLFKQHQQTYLYYHNLQHTLDVVQHTAEIAAHYKLHPSHQLIVLAAAWFHDTGQLFADYATHELKGKELMEEYLQQQDVPADIISEIGKCIMATKMPVHPVSLLEKIICDADTYHLGTDAFPAQDELVWQEMYARTGISMELRTEKTLAFMRSHQFYTAYCHSRLAEGKAYNIDQLVAQITK